MSDDTKKKGKTLQAVSSQPTMNTSSVIAGSDELSGHHHKGSSHNEDKAQAQRLALYQELSETRRTLRDLFIYFSLIERPYAQRLSAPSSTGKEKDSKLILKKKSQPVQIDKLRFKAFHDHLTNILKLASMLKQRKGGNPSWAELFHEEASHELLSNHHVIATHVGSPTSGGAPGILGGALVSKDRGLEALSILDVLSPSKIDYYLQLLHCFLETNELATDIQTRQAIELLQFLETHRLDPYSLLIGLEPQKDILNNITNIDEMSLFLLHSDSRSLKQQQLELKDKDPRGIASALGCDLIRRIMKWSAIEDPTELAKEVVEFAAVLRGVDKLTNGDIVVAKLPLSAAEKESWAELHPKETRIPDCKMVYGRFTGERRGNSIGLFLTPTENEIERIPMQNVFPLTPEIKTLMQSCSTAGLENLVHQPVDDFYKAMMHTLEQLAIEYLTTKYHMNIPLLLRSEEKVSLDHLFMFKGYMKSFADAYEKTLDEFLQRCTTVSQKKVSEFLATKSNTFFLPTKLRAIQQLQSFQFSNFASMHVQRFKGCCEAILHYMSAEIKLILSGTRKRELTEWWLELIHSRVESFLIEKGYCKDAVPDNYTLRPPDNLGAVVSNLHLLQEIINPKEDKHHVQALISNLKDQIYPRINDFEKQVRIVLADAFDVEVAEVEKMTIAEQERHLSLLREKFGDSERLISLDDLIKDLEYLSEMQRLETESTGEDSLHIVPVTGLIVSVFLRLENECKTVLELWEPVDEKKVPGRTSLHQAISSDDFEAVKELLATEGVDINSQDDNGWTPLHCACGTEGRLAIALALLALENIDVNIPNKDGNIPLHYLVRNRKEANAGDVKSLHLEALQMMVKRGTNVNTANRFGETPLHSSCFSGNTEVVRALLEAGANPNAPTSTDGQTPLHYAVRTQNIPVVQLLLEFSADPGVKSKYGSCEEVAMSRSSPQILELLRSKAKPTETSFSKATRRVGERRATLIAIGRRPGAEEDGSRIGLTSLPRTNTCLVSSGEAPVPTPPTDSASSLPSSSPSVGEGSALATPRLAGQQASEPRSA